MNQDSNAQRHKPHSLSSVQELIGVTQSFPKRYLMIGSGARLQFANPKQAVNDVINYLNAQGNQATLIIFGGDTADRDNPDLGYLVQQVKAKLIDTVKVLSVQSWSDYCPFVDYVFHYPRTFCERSNKELWGGVQNGRPIAATHYYLNHRIQTLLNTLICIGGGEIARQELAYVIEQDLLKHHYIRAEVRHHRDMGIYGPTDGWYNTLEHTSH